MLRRIVSALAGVAALVASAGAAQVALYPTGPAEDSAFLRFVNTTGTALTVTADDAQNSIDLAAPSAATGFQAVPANRAVQGTLVTASGKTPLSLTVAPGEFATVVAASADAGGAPALHVVREQPDDFNAMRASLALAVADPDCEAASLGVAGREVSIFQDVASGSVARRAINPVRLTVQARCAGQPVGAALDLGELAPGGRYTVILAPSAQGTLALFANDQAD
ncbi:alginate O-acetyltransferase AlgF [Achromobacter sp. GG226]|nr:alginate O-acetyltransferase AlgF [Verticiella sp. GG226]